MPNFDARHIASAGQQIIHKGGIHDLSIFIEHQLFVEGVANALGNAAVDLPVQDEGVDHIAAVVHRHIFLDLQ